MSEQKPNNTPVPDGYTSFYTTRQKAPSEKGFVGFETVWKPLQKEVEYYDAEKALARRWADRLDRASLQA